jgi:hypothetical protein
MKILPTLATVCTFCNAIWLIATPGAAQLRIVDYNTTDGPRAGLSTVLQAIGEEAVNGFAKPIDVLSLQEQSSSATTTQAIVDLLNGYYGAGTYARATLDGGTNGAGRPGLIYNTNTVELVEQIAFGTLSTSAQARQTLRYRLRPVDYGDEAVFYVYSNHYKAGTAGSDLSRRNIEAVALRTNLDALGQGVHAILTGDYNIQSSNESSYQTLLAPGDGKVFDPIDSPGNWHDSSAYRSVHTQAPAVSPSSGLIGGGVDDRFDFQLVTEEFLDDEGLAYIRGSYHAFGNNGTHALNGNISSGTGAASSVLSALMTASDHLPVVADYQLPAVLDVVTAAIPTTLQLGQAFQLAITVSNAADVLVPLGADELDYTLSTSGNVFGMYSGSDAALGGSNEHFVMFDTTTTGLKTGLITVSTSSQGVAGGTVNLPVSFEVIQFPQNGDFNGNGVVDAADYVVWRNGLGTVYAQEDYNNWRAHFGQSFNSRFIVNRAVPEPAACIDVMGAIVLLLSRRRNDSLRSTNLIGASTQRRQRRESTRQRTR